MKDEIKEILELYKNKDIEYYNLVNDLGYDKLLDYITNLEKKVNGLQEERDYLYSKLNSECKRLQQLLEFEIERNDLKQNIIDEAIEYIQNDMPYLEEPDDDYENNHKMIEYDRSVLLNILQGSDK